jgi:hypothetical protein
MPAILHLASLAYQTADGGVLGSQAPAPVVNDGNVDRDEFLIVPVEAIRDENANGIFDRLEPGLGFIVTGGSKVGPDFMISWNCFPGRSYRIQSSPTLAPDSWSDVPGSEVTAGATELSLTRPVPASAGAAFYRVILLP